MNDKFVEIIQMNWSYKRLIDNEMKVDSQENGLLKNFQKNIKH